MSRVMVVARREIVQAARQRSLLLSTAFSVAVLAAIVLLPDVLGFGGPSQQDVVAVPGAALERAEAAREAQDAFGIELHVEQAASARAAADAVAGGDADIAVLDRRLVVAEGASDAAVAAIQQAAQAAQAREALEQAGVEPAVAQRVLDPPGLAVRTAQDGGDEGIAFVALLVLYGQLIGYGFVVASGIVEEKSSRVVEILLAVLRPRELLAGKVLGIGVVGLVQLLVIAAAGLTMGAASGAIALDGDAWTAVGLVLAWFLLGYAFFSAAFAVAGALVPRQEELQAVTTPLTVLLVATFVLAFPAIEDPGSGLATTLSFLPFSAPLVMPARGIAGDVALWEVLGAAGSVVAGTLLLIALAGRVYRAGALETGSRVGLLSALRAGSRA